VKVRTLAPAKINWTLEVLGKRVDGYHEIKSVMQTITLCDEIEVTKKEEGSGKLGAGESVVTGSVTLAVEGEHQASRDDLTFRAVQALEEVEGRQSPVAIRLVKRIPVGAGLGGGSSDAAAVLRTVNVLFDLGYCAERLTGIAAAVGSDVAFFLHGGTALAEGRGEQITLLPDVPPTWLVLIAPAIRMPDKTKRMYEALKPEDFTDGERSEALTARVRASEPIDVASLYNSFERVAYECFAGLAIYRDALFSAGAPSVHLAGAGPALFGVFASREDAEAVADKIKIGRAVVARTPGAEPATRVIEAL